jgi:hypothetical protein
MRRWLRPSSSPKPTEPGRRSQQRHGTAGNNALRRGSRARCGAILHTGRRTARKTMRLSACSIHETSRRRVSRQDHGTPTSGWSSVSTTIRAELQRMPERPQRNGAVRGDRDSPDWCRATAAHAIGLPPTITHEPKTQPCATRTFLAYATSRTVGVRGSRSQPVAGHVHPLPARYPPALTQRDQRS